MPAPDEKDVSLLRGIVRLDRHDAATKAMTGFVDLGFCDRFDMPPLEDTRAELYNPRTKAGGLVKTSPVRRLPKFEIEGYDLNTFNVALQVMGIIGALGQSSGTATAQPLNAAAQKGVTYYLGKRTISALVVKQGATTLVLGTDYSANVATGSIYTLPGGAVTVGAAISADFAYATVALETVAIGAAKRIQCSIAFEGDSADGAIYDARLWACEILPSRAFSLIQDPTSTQYAKWGISGNVLDDTAGAYGGSANEPFGRKVKIGQVA